MYLYQVDYHRGGRCWGEDITYLVSSNSEDPDEAEAIAHTRLAERFKNGGADKFGKGDVTILGDVSLLSHGIETDYEYWDN